MLVWQGKDVTWMVKAAHKKGFMIWRLTRRATGAPLSYVAKIFPFHLAPPSSHRVDYGLTVVAYGVDHGVDRLLNVDVRLLVST